MVKKKTVGKSKKFLALTPPVDILLT